MVDPASMAQPTFEQMGKTGPAPLCVRPLKPSQQARPAAWLCGLDLGMMYDPTALAIVRMTVDTNNGKRVNRYAVLHLQRWLGVDYPTIAEELRPMLAALSPLPTLIGDETGVGLATLQILRRAKLPVAALKGICITAGHQTTVRSEGGFNVPKRELVAVGQSALQGERLEISPKLKDAKTLRKELQTFITKINAVSATESFEAWREGDHDDLVLATCMAVWYGEQCQQPTGALPFGLGYRLNSV